MVDRDNTKAINADRRRMLQILGFAGVTGLAGCSGDSGGDDGNGGDGGNGNTPQSPIDDTYSLADLHQAAPPDAQYNPYNPKNFNGVGEYLLWDSLAKGDFETGELKPLLAKDWTFPDSLEEGSTVTVTLQDGYTWHDGSQVAAKDLATELKIDKFPNPTGIWAYTDSVTADGKTLELSLSTSVNPDVYKFELLKRRLYLAESRFGKYIESLEDASSDEAVEEAYSELQSFAPSEPLGNGPFEFEEASETKVQLSKYSDYDNGIITADDINFSNVELIFAQDQSDRTRALKNNGDGLSETGLNKAQIQSLPDHMNIIKVPGSYGTAPAFNMEHPIFGRRKVRQAIAHLVNRTEFVENITGGTFNNKVVEIPTNLTGAQTETYVGEKRSEFSTWDVNEERAATLLQEEGFSRENGDWYTPDGDRFNAPIKAPSFWVSQSQTVKNQLESFGIKTELLTQEASTFWGQTLAENDFGIATYLWGAVQTSPVHPYQNFRELYTGNASNYLNHVTTADREAGKTEVEVPMPVGDPDGSLESVDVVALTEELGIASDSERVNEIVTKLAWTFNQNLPMIPCQIYSALSIYSTDEWDFPSEDSSAMKYHAPAYWPIKTGDMQAKTE